jgi:hypothetical protein
MRTTLWAAGWLAGVVLTTPAFAFDSASISADRELSSFESVYIPPVKVALDHRVGSGPSYIGGDRPVREEDAADKAADFHEDLVDAFGDSFSLASGSGLNVLTVEATLTRLQSSRPTMADLQEEPGLSMQSRYAGGASMRVVFSENGSPLAEVGDGYTESLDRHRFEAGMWDDANRAFSMWSRQLVDFVEKN